MAASSTCCQVAPAPTRAVRPGTSTTHPDRPEVCTRIVSAPIGTAPWPVACTATFSPRAAANRMTAATSVAPVASTTAPGLHGHGDVPRHGPLVDALTGQRDGRADVLAQPGQRIVDGVSGDVDHGHLRSPSRSDVTGGKHRRHRLEGTWSNRAGRTKKSPSGGQPKASAAASTRCMPSRRASAATARAAVRRAAPRLGQLRGEQRGTARSAGAPPVRAAMSFDPREVGPRPFVVTGQRVQPRTWPARRGPRCRPGRSPRCGRRTARARRAGVRSTACSP